MPRIRILAYFSCSTRIAIGSDGPAQIITA